MCINVHSPPPPSPVLLPLQCWEADPTSENRELIRSCSDAICQSPSEGGARSQEVRTPTVPRLSLPSLSKQTNRAPRDALTYMAQYGHGRADTRKGTPCRAETTPPVLASKTPEVEEPVKKKENLAYTFSHVYFCSTERCIDKCNVLFRQAKINYNPCCLNTLLACSTCPRPPMLVYIRACQCLFPLNVCRYMCW